MATRKAAAAKREPTARESLRAVAVMFEQLSAQMKVVVETIALSHEQLRSEIRNCEARLSTRISAACEAARSASAPPS